MKYRKKPVVIEAFEYDGDFMSSDGEYYVPVWAMIAHSKGLVYFDSFYAPGDLFVKTLEGNMKADVGDYIIKGVQGEIYPCKPDIFKQTYEKV